MTDIIWYLSHGAHMDSIHAAEEDHNNIQIPVCQILIDTDNIGSKMAPNMTILQLIVFRY